MREDASPLGARSTMRDLLDRIEHEALTAEVAPVPQIIIRHPAELEAAIAEHGALLRLADAAFFAGVSRARIHQMAGRGRFQRINLLGSLLVPFDEVQRWATGARRAGRPRKHA